MGVYKRYKGKRIQPGDPNWPIAKWTMEFRLRNHHVWQAIPEARTKAEGERAENKVRKDIYDLRYGGGKEIGFSDYFEQFYLPWAVKKKSSYKDDVSRAGPLKEFFGNRPMRAIITDDCEKMKAKLAGKKTPRPTPRSDATVNRYMSLLSKIFSRAVFDKAVDSNPCKGVEKADEGDGRERYLLPSEYDRLSDVLVGDLLFLRLPLEVALGTGLRKDELLGLKADHINFGNEPKFCSAKGHATRIDPSCLLVVKSKNKKTRQIPMNKPVRTLLLEALRERASTENVFTVEHNGVSKHSLKWGFEEACKRAKIAYGQTNPEGGIIWHDLRRTFATRLRANGVHEYDIKYLLGHSIPGVTKTYARETIAALQAAVNKLTEPWGEVIKFERKVG